MTLYKKRSSPAKLDSSTPSGKENSWIDYWDTEDLFTDKKWLKDMDVFVRATHPLLNYNSDDVILDIGCGPGFLALSLKDTIKEIHCLDTSQRYLDICKHKLSGAKNVYFYKLDERNYTDLSLLKDKKFTLMICLSVIQYYKNIGELEKLIEEVRAVALPGSRFLIADLIVTNQILLDIWGVLKTACKEKYLFETLKYLIKARTSNYFRTRDSLGLLVISVEELEGLINKLNLKAEILDMQLTSASNRRHLLIKF
jgi:ubiquinone/menaquinone biosynthesis C-methylase UbiE